MTDFPFDVITADDGTPLGPLRAEAFIERTEGFKTYARGYQPAWARDAG